MLEREVSTEDAERQAKRHARRSALEAVAALCRETLLSAEGKNARAYLEGRGLDYVAQEELGLGLYPYVNTLETALRAGGHDVEAARAEGLLFTPMTGYAVFPWADPSGQPMTLYGRWPGKTVPDDKADKKTLALPGEGTKASPLYFDRARQAGLRDLVLVEGLIDAALLQAKGEAGVIACMSAQFSVSQLETLGRYGVRSITICLDPDSAGEKGTLACIKGLYEKGINTFVAFCRKARTRTNMSSRTVSRLGESISGRRSTPSATERAPS
jgi:DNA primase